MKELMFAHAKIPLHIVILYIQTPFPDSICQPGQGNNFTVKNNAPDPAYKAPYGFLRSPKHGLMLPDGVINSGRFQCTQCGKGKYNAQPWNDKCSDCEKGTHAGWLRVVSVGLLHDGHAIACATALG